MMTTTTTTTSRQRYSTVSWLLMMIVLAQQLATAQARLRSVDAVAQSATNFKRDLGRLEGHLTGPEELNKDPWTEPSASPSVSLVPTMAPKDDGQDGNEQQGLPDETESPTLSPTLSPTQSPTSSPVEEPTNLESIRDDEPEVRINSDNGSNGLSVAPITAMAIGGTMLILTGLWMQQRASVGSKADMLDDDSGEIFEDDDSEVPTNPNI